MQGHIKGFQVCSSNLGKMIQALGSNPKPFSPPEVDRIWLWVYYNKIPLYPIFYLLEGDHKPYTVGLGTTFQGLGIRGSGV